MVNTYYPSCISGSAGSADIGQLQLISAGLSHVSAVSWLVGWGRHIQRHLHVWWVGWLLARVTGARPHVSLSSRLLQMCSCGGWKGFQEHQEGKLQRASPFWTSTCITFASNSLNHIDLMTMSRASVERHLGAWILADINKRGCDCKST